MTRRPVRPPRWTAGPDGVGHAHIGRITACGHAPIEERFAWPMTWRCQRCVVMVGTPLMRLFV